VMAETKKLGIGRGAKALTSTLRKIVTFSVNESFGGSSETCLL
jgi:hypothetical protein